MAVVDIEQPKKKPRWITINGGHRKTTQEITFVEEQAINKSRQKRHSETTKTTTTTALAEFLTSIANDDMLFEIFTRLPDARSAHYCATVCKRWRSAIYQPHFVSIFKRHHQKRQQQEPSLSTPFTLLLRVMDVSERRGYRELFSEDSKTLHGLERSSGKSSYLDFLPLSSMVRASCKDLLLVDLPLGTRQMCVCNPLTRQRVPLPETPHLNLPTNTVFHEYDHYALVCHPNSDHNHFTVVVSKKHSHHIRAAVFRSETGRWDESAWSFPIGDGLYRFHSSVATIDGAFYTPLSKIHEKLEKISVFDPFDATTGLAYREIVLPRGFKRGWRGKRYRCRIGAVRGRLRLWQSYFDKRVDRFVFRTWQLNNKYEEWVKVNDLKLATATESESKFRDSSAVIAVHPDDDDVFFYKDDMPSIWEYRIGTGSCKKIGEIGMWGESVVYTVEHQAWPTFIPQLIAIWTRCGDKCIVKGPWPPSNFPFV